MSFPQLILSPAPGTGPGAARTTRAARRVVARALGTLLLLGSVLLGLALPAAAQDSPTELPVIRLTAGIHVIRAEIGQTPEQRMKGLMFRDRLGTNQGMAFVFEQVGVHCMWMKNTYIPLSVAFLSNDGTILNIEDMQPHTENSHCAAKPARYALEMNLGWFAKRGIKPGSKIQGLPKS